MGAAVSEEFLPGLGPAWPRLPKYTSSIVPLHTPPRFLSPARCPCFLPCAVTPQAGPLTSLSYWMLINARTSDRFHLAHAHRPSRVPSFSLPLTVQTLFSMISD